ncbi:MAG: transcription termination/antitermination protein NusA, partial [Lentisphaeria bacterium]|nr:transcription termination/antitermination protein NusA [Lentisphaeria bacterium]
YAIGERLNALLVKVDTTTSGPSLILSRSNPYFVKRLFEREISEIHDGIVEIVSISRDAGSRTKIAVKSNDPRVDPVGACVGMRGIRVRNITGELGNEHVDIIRYEEDIAAFVTNALHPAPLEEIEIDEDTHTLFIHLKNENSRLAFGKKAQNVRLAQKLVGWAIKFIIDDAEQRETFEEKKKQVIASLAASVGISTEAAAVLVNNGYLTLDGICAADMNDIAALKGLDDTALVAISKARNQGAKGE